ncbi:MAG: 5-formyltetrahydrofolate cyclo-ligase [bacterium]
MPDNPDTKNRKALIRDAVTRRLQAQPADVFEHSGRLLLSRFRSSKLPVAGSTVFAFASMNAELNTWPLLEWLWLSGDAPALPLVRGRRMSFHRVSGAGELRRGVFDIREPAAHLQQVSPERDSIILVPGLAFTLSGTRLGRGGGYYDRFLSERPAGARAVGVCFDFQIHESLPTAGHDADVDEVWVIPCR